MSHYAFRLGLSKWTPEIAAFAEGFPGVFSPPTDATLVFTATSLPSKRDAAVGTARLLNKEFILLDEVAIAPEFREHDLVQSLLRKARTLAPTVVSLVPHPDDCPVEAHTINLLAQEGACRLADYWLRLPGSGVRHTLNFLGRDERPSTDQLYAVVGAILAPRVATTAEMKESLDRLPADPVYARGWGKYRHEYGDYQE